VVDGVSFVPLMCQGHPPNRPTARALFWHYPNNWGPRGPGIGPSSSIVHDGWKLIYYHADRRYELFHLHEDLSEKTNLAEQQPEIRDRLARRLGEYLKRVDAQMPTDSRTGKPVPYPESSED